MEFIRRYIFKVDYIISGTILLVIFIDVLLQILSRILPGNSISWTVELGQVLLGALIWIGISMSIPDSGHVSFDLLINKFPMKLRKYAAVINMFLFCIYLVLLGTITVGLLLHYLKTGDKTTMLGISLFWVRMPMLIGCILTSIRLLIKIYLVLTNKENLGKVSV